MPIIVQKYGGSSVATVEHLKQVADKVVALKRGGHSVVVVVSAMGDATDELLERARAVAPQPRGRELDMLLSVGERISMSLLALAIRELGEEAVSLTGSQCGIITTASHNNARIMEVRPFRVQDELHKDRIVIVAGYQGVSYQRDVTTLGRGGSDTTAVALAAALDAEACEIYSDVAGVYSADPRVVPEAQPLAEIGYDEMSALARSGAKVLNAQAVAFARARNIALYARQTGSEAPGSVIRRDAPRAPTGVRGVAHRKHVVQIEAAGQHFIAITALIRDLGLRPLQSAFSSTSATWTLDPEEIAAPQELSEAIEAITGQAGVVLDRGCVSLVGEDVHCDAATVCAFVELAAELECAVSASVSNAASVSLVVPQEHVLGLLRAAHTRFCGS